MSTIQRTAHPMNPPRVVRADQGDDAIRPQRLSPRLTELLTWLNRHWDHQVTLQNTSIAGESAS